MPTAVERSFLKLDGIDGRHEQAALTNAFLKIDSDFLKLSTAPNTDAFLKIEDSRQLKNSVDVIGDAFIKLGDDFGEIARGALKIDEFVIKWTAVSSATGAASVDFNPQADFLKLDSALTTSGADLKILGSDFLKLDNSSSLKVFDHKLEGVGADFLKLEGDTAADQAAFLKLGADFLKIGDVSDPSPLDLASIRNSAAPCSKSARISASYRRTLACCCRRFKKSTAAALRSHRPICCPKSARIPRSAPVYWRSTRLS